MTSPHGAVSRDAHAVLLPALSDLDVEARLGEFLRRGGRAILLGETREEYLARRMSQRRRAEESADRMEAMLWALRARHGSLIVAVDEELGGIRRLEGLVPDLPRADAAARMRDGEIEEAAFGCASAAKAIGVNMFLAPVIDVVTGSNPWLAGRSLGPDREQVGRIGAAYVTGVQRAGIVAVAKHFPGYSDLAGDPAESDVALDVDEETLWHLSTPFARVIDAGVKAVMMGPARAKAIDPDHGVSLSAAAIGILKRKFRYSGVVVTDDLDAPATLRDRTLEDIAVAALAAGADLLLLAAGDHLETLCAQLVEAVRDGRLSADRLNEAATRVRSLAEAHQ